MPLVEIPACYHILTTFVKLYTCNTLTALPSLWNSG